MTVTLIATVTRATTNGNAHSIDFHAVPTLLCDKYLNFQVNTFSLSTRTYVSEQINNAIYFPALTLLLLTIEAIYVDGTCLATLLGLPTGGNCP